MLLFGVGGRLTEVGDRQIKVSSRKLGSVAIIHESRMSLIFFQHYSTNKTNYKAKQSEFHSPPLCHLGKYTSSSYSY